MPRRFFLVFLFCTAGVAACDEVGLDPTMVPVLPATHATARTVTIEAALSAPRVRGVNELFAEVAGTLPAAELRRHARLHGEAHSALRMRQRALATQKLEAVRAEEIRLVLQATNGRAAADLLRELSAITGAVKATLELEEDAGRDVARMQRMYSSATDLLNRAGRAESEGDHGTALDLGSHAAGLLNSLRHLLQY